MEVRDGEGESNRMVSGEGIVFGMSSIHVQ